MSVTATPKSLPTYSLDEMKKQTKNNPFVDDYHHYSQAAKPKSTPAPQPVRKITLPKFFNELIDKKIHQVALMVLFHIVHFFCHIFWQDYREEFDRREAAHSQKTKALDDLKKDHSKLGQKVTDFLKKNPPKPVPQPIL